MSSKSLQKKDLICYGFIAFPLAFAGIPLYIHAPDFYATEYAVSLSSLGGVLLLLRLIDAIQDPVIGTLSDRFPHKRRTVMTIAAFMLALAFLAVFLPLTSATLLWFAITVFLATTAFSVLSINLNTLGGLWSDNAHEKTVIVSWREAFGLIGLILAVVLPSVLQTQVSKSDSFLIMGVLLAAITFISVLLLLKWFTRHDRTSQKTTGDRSAGTRLLLLPKNTRTFFVIYAISMLASAIPAVLVLFFIRDRLGLEAYSGTFLLLYFVAGFVGVVCWKWLSQRISKEKSWLYSMILAIGSFIWAVFLSEGDAVQYAIICVSSGIAFGAELVLPASILADHIHAHNKKSQASTYFSLLAFLLKSSMALAAASSFFLIDVAGLNPGEENTTQALMTLTLCYAAIPCLLKLISTFLLWRYYDQIQCHSNNGSLTYA